MPRKKPPKLPANIFRNALLAVDADGNTIARIEPKHMAKAILAEFKGVEGIAKLLRLLMEDDATSPKVRFEILKFAATSVYRAGDMEPAIDLDKLSLEDLRRQRDELMKKVINGEMTPERINVIRQCLGMETLPPQDPNPMPPMDKSVIDVEIKELLALADDAKT